MTPAYAKPHLTMSQQVELLRSRGMIIPDADAATYWLGVVGYYRLSGYWYPYRAADGAGDDVHRGDRFLAGTSFDQIIALYDFDRHLKLLVLEAIERFEIAMRVRVGHTLGAHGAYAHLDPSLLDGRFSEAADGETSRYAAWLDGVTRAQERSKDDFVEHFRMKYDDRLPIWVLTEILEFGSLSTLYQGMSSLDRNVVALGLGVMNASGQGNGKALTNWMHVLTVVRNICAHHFRFWNRNLTIQLATKHLRPIPKLSHLASSSGQPPVPRIFSALCLLAFVLDGLFPESGWVGRVSELINSRLPASGREAHEMGFPSNWDLLPCWR